jgi:predicted ester cyclase
MSSQSDKKTLSRIPLEAFNEGRPEVVDDVAAPDFVSHGQPPGFPPGREGLKALIGAIRSAFPDLRYEELHVVAEGDTVVQHVRASGTMKGDFNGMQPTGKHATWEEVHIVRMRDGKAVEHWPVLDQLSMLQQLGFAPEFPTARAA